MKKYILILLLGLLLGCKGEKATEKKVKTALIEKKGIDTSSSHGGRVFPRDRIQLMGSSSGVVEEVFFKEGDEVKKGDILFKYRPNVIVENEIKLSEAKLELEMVENELENYDIQKKETGIKNRELEIKALEYEIKKGKDQLPIYRSSIESARKILTMYKDFLKEESVSVFEVEQKKTELLAKESEYEALKMKLALDEQKYNVLMISGDQVERELLYKEEKLKSKYETLKKEYEIYERALRESREGYEAPADGILTKFNVQSQEKLERLQNIGTLASGEKLVVNVKIPIYQASKIKIGQRANIKFSDFSGTKKYVGEVSRVSNFATESGNKLGIDAEINILEGDGRDLKPGYRVDVEILSSEKEEYLLVKKFSVLEENNKKYIFVLNKNIAKKLEVEVGAEGESDYEVLNVPEGTKVILNPFIVQDGDRVEEIL